jgi:hypothetical protein
MFLARPLTGGDSPKWSLAEIPDVFVIELSLKLSPMPVAVQRKEQSAADAVYQQVKQAMESGQPRLLELTCEKEESKRVTLLTSEVVAVQTYEKSAIGGGSKRPGFSFDG